MALMTWNSNFVTGIDIIDEQHRWLIDLINAAAPVLAIDYDSNHKRADGLLGLDQSSTTPVSLRDRDRLMRSTASTRATRPTTWIHMAVRCHGHLNAGLRQRRCPEAAASCSASLPTG